MQKTWRKTWPLIGALLGASLCAAQPAAALERGAHRVASARSQSLIIKHELDIAEGLLRKRLEGLPTDSQIALLRDPLQVTLRVPASVLFEPDGSQLKPDSLQAVPLSVVIELLRKRYRLVGQVNVYSDGIGGPIANHGLTEQRELAILTALHTTAIRPTRVSGAGMGAEAEIGNDETPEGREQNRRVELVFALPQPGVTRPGLRP